MQLHCRRLVSMLWSWSRGGYAKFVRQSCVAYLGSSALGVRVLQELLCFSGSSHYSAQGAHNLCARGHPGPKKLRLGLGMQHHPKLFGEGERDFQVSMFNYCGQDIFIFMVPGNFGIPDLPCIGRTGIVNWDSSLPDVWAYKVHRYDTDVRQECKIQSLHWLYQCHSNCGCACDLFRKCSRIFDTRCAAMWLQSHGRGKSKSRSCWIIIIIM